jgi:hypothetical protein
MAPLWCKSEEHFAVSGIGEAQYGQPERRKATAATSLRMRREQILEHYHSSRLRLLAALLEEWQRWSGPRGCRRPSRVLGTNSGR